MHRLCLQRDLSTLNAAYIQHIIDKGQKMLAGNGYLFQIVLYLVMVVDVRLRQRGETDDGIHGRPDIVGHIKQELPLGEIGLGFTLNGELECGVFLFERLPVFLLGVLLLHQEIPCGVPAESLHKRQNHDIHDQRDYQIHHGEVIDLMGGNIGIMYLYKPSAWVFFRRRFGKASVSNCGLFSDSAHKNVLNPYCIRHWNYQPTTLQFETGVP